MSESDAQGSHQASDGLVENQVPPQASPPPEVHQEPEDREEIERFEMEAKLRAPGWPKRFFHPVHGGRIFEDGTEHELAGPDWRFTTAALADMARTQAEAEEAHFHAVRTRVGDREDTGHGIVRNSAQAQQSLDAGYPEPNV